MVRQRCTAALQPAGSASPWCGPPQAALPTHPQVASCSCLTAACAASSAATATTGGKSRMARRYERRTRSSRVREARPAAPAGLHHLAQRENCRFQPGLQWQAPAAGCHETAAGTTSPAIPTAVGNTETLNCYYAHADQDDGLQARASAAGACRDAALLDAKLAAHAAAVS